MISYCIYIYVIWHDHVAYLCTIPSGEGDSCHVAFSCLFKQFLDEHLKPLRTNILAQACCFGQGYSDSASLSL